MAFPQIKKIRILLAQKARMLGERAFLTFLGLLAIVLVAGAAIFYSYDILASKKEIKKIEDSSPRFNEAAYRGVLGAWQKREANFNKAGSVGYPELFK